MAFDFAGCVSCVVRWGGVEAVNLLTKIKYLKIKPDEDLTQGEFDELIKFALLGATANECWDKSLENNSCICNREFDDSKCKEYVSRFCQWSDFCKLRKEIEPNG
jgi:hypothetical protein